MSLSRLWLSLAVALPVLGSLVAVMETVDLAYHLRAGTEILASGALPSQDTWTFTAFGEPWTDQQWGAQVVLHGVEALGGWAALAVFRAVLIGSTFAAVLVAVHRRGLDARTASVLTLGAFVVALPALALRPQLLGVVCFALSLLLISDRRSHPRRLWLVPFIVAAWANLHGSFFLGPVMLVLAWLEDVHDGADHPHRTLAIALVSIVAACVTPFGPWVWAYAVGLSTDPEVTARITEWQPTSIRTVSGVLFIASVGAIVVAIARRRRVVPWPTLAWLAVFLAIGLYAERGLAWWPLAAAVAVAGTIIPARPDVAPAESAVMRRLNIGVLVALAVAAVLLLPMWRPIDPDLGAPEGILGHAPPGVTAALRDVAGPEDHVFNPQPWGSWFEHAIPDARYAIDSRIELFPAEVWGRYETVVAGVEGWEEILADWEVSVVVVAADQGRGFPERLRAAGWTDVYEDDDGQVFRR